MRSIPVAALLALLAAPPALAQVPAYEDDFECNDDNSFGDPAGRFGWSANLRGVATFEDDWRTDLSGGVSPSTDELTNGSGFGPPLDWFENFLLTGHPLMADTRAEVRIGSQDDDGIGVVVRYSGPARYYACAMSNNRGPSCTGGADLVGNAVRLYRVDTTQACSSNYVVDSSNFTYQQNGNPYPMRLTVVGGLVTCDVDVNRNGSFTDPIDRNLSFTDPSPLPAGEAGLVAWDTGNADASPPGGDTVFDDFVLTSFDADADADGVPDAVELAVGTNPNLADSDLDTILDRHELGYFAVPYDRDNDGIIDALDLDSDGDGFPDNQEAGDALLSTPPVDSVCTNNGFEDYADSGANPGPCTSDAACPGVVLSSCNLTTGRCDAPDSDGDGVRDPVDPDSDNDGVPDVTEGGGVNPTADANANGLPDFLDPTAPGFVDANGDGIDDRFDLDGDGVPNHADLDADNDGIPDLIEAGGADGNGDGRIDGFIDTNNNGVHDPLQANPLPVPNTDGVQGPDFLDRDADGDGITDATEAGGADADGDGVIDGFTDPNGNGLSEGVEGSPLLRPDTDGDGIRNYQDVDSDGDGVPDATEGHDADLDGAPDRTSPGTDTDGDGLEDTFDPDAGGTIAPLPNTDGSGGANYADNEDDGDGIPTALEGTGDFDGDGRPNYLDADSDGDGVADAVECPAVVANACPDSDMDGRPDFLDLDDDGDGIRSALEGLADPDGDGVPAYLDDDSDGDGFVDAVEGHDANADGVADRGPLGTDANLNGLDDAFEAAQGGVEAPRQDFDGDATPDYLDVDSDGDALADSAEGGGDIDGDGRPHYLDLDSDGDGLRDVIEGRPDTDGDGTPDRLDLDSDGDGFPDSTEGHDANADGLPDRTPLGVDADGDGLDDAFDQDQGGVPAPNPNLDRDALRDPRDPDDDGDGIPSLVEGASDLDGDGRPAYLDVDSDGDGVSDAVECLILVANMCPDSDMDGRPDFLDVDDDGDGILTSVEGTADPDGDGIPNYLDPDSDGDGVLDVVEGQDRNGDGVPDVTPSGLDVDGDGLDDAFDPTQGGTLAMPVDLDGDGIPNYLDDDADGDGIDDAIDGLTDADGDGRPNYLDLDSDGDGLTDQQEGILDPDGDGRPSHDDPDSDGDGVLDATEGHDSDFDGAPNRTPLGVDADNDGLDDAFDPSQGGTPAVTLDRDMDGTPNVVDDDDDGDGISTASELPLMDSDGDGFPNYLDADDDGDGIPSAVECGAADFAACPDTDGDGTPDVLDDDSDDDGFPDSVECASQPCPDLDGDGLEDFRDDDDDGDGIATAREVADQAQFGTPDGDNIDAWRDTDSDGDGVLDATEGLLDVDMDLIPDYLDPDSSPQDTDGDGIPDVIECNGPTAGCLDSDGDGLADHLDDDDDGDGIPTAVECTTPQSCPDLDMDGRPDHLDIDEDGDGLRSVDEGGVAMRDTDGDGVPDYLDVDSDGDGIPDAIEAHDVDADGAPDVPPLGVDGDTDGLDDAYDPDNGGVTPVPPDFDLDTRADHLDVDADADGIRDDVELGDGSRPDEDGDGAPNYLDGDSDGDGLDDALEGHDADADGIADVVPSGTDADGDGLDDAFDASEGGVEAPTPDRDMDRAPDYLDVDDDGDSILTATEVADTAMYGDPEADGVPPYLDSDSDDDGAPDLVEGRLDLDNDGVPDYLDPDSVVVDSDGDGIPDIEECPDPSMPANCPDTDGDGTPDLLDPDDDGDGVPTLQERPQGDRDTDGDGTPDHRDPDDDGDGLDTIAECPDSLPCPDFDGDGTADFLDPDDDDDGIPTATELADGLVHGADPDGDAASNWLDTDADGDGVDDALECPDPAVGCPDGDGDGIPDYLDPTDDPAVIDSDGDGLPDSVECPDPAAGCPDSDGDLTPDFQDPDDDGDGILTRFEAPDGDGDGDPADARDSDGDGIPDYLDPDDDDDGVLTRFEAPDPDGDGDPSDARDTDLDGAVDYLDADDDDDGLPTREESPDPNGDGDPADARDFDQDGVPGYLDFDEDDFAQAGFAGGAGCSATGPVSTAHGVWLFLGLLMLGLVVRRRRRLATTTAALTLGLVASSASAQQVSVDRYVPAERVTEGWAISRPNTPGHLKLSAMLQIDYANDPVVFEVRQGDARTERFPVVGDQLVGHVVGSLTVVDRVLVYVGLPINLVLSGDADERVGFTAGKGGLGDLYAGGRFRLVGEPDDLYALSMQARLTLPTAGAADGDQTWAGDGSLTFHPEAVFEVRPIGDLRIAANLGARIRRQERFAGISIGPEFTFGVGIAHPILKGDWKLDGDLEVYGASAFSNLLGREESAIEALAGLKVTAPFGLVFGVAFGPGLSRGLGSPDYRGVAMIGFASPDDEPQATLPVVPVSRPASRPAPALEPKPEPEPEPTVTATVAPPPPPPAAPPPAVETPETPPIEIDEDGDGIVGAADRCPTEKEDVDTFEDDDGCPDLDNDKDGVPDTKDGAPLQPEDKDAFEDDDGVPDPDNDQDGVLDDDDECPLAPGPAETKGCPKSVRVDAASGRILILKRVEFATNRDVILERSFPLLGEVKQTLEANPQLKKVRVEGHTDALGPDAYNLDLSMRRARSVKRWLVLNGVAVDRLVAVGCGETKPVSSNATKQGRQENRRVEFNIVDPAPPGGVPALDGCREID